MITRIALSLKKAAAIRRSFDLNPDVNVGIRRPGSAVHLRLRPRIFGSGGVNEAHRNGVRIWWIWCVYAVIITWCVGREDSGDLHARFRHHIRVPRTSRGCAHFPSIPTWISIRYGSVVRPRFEMKPTTLWSPRDPRGNVQGPTISHAQVS